MNTVRRAALIYAWLAVSLVWLPEVAAQAPPAPGLSLTFEQMEAFLLEARVVSSHEISVGINNTRRATLSDGSLTHDAQIQTVDISKFVYTPPKGPTELNFKDTYRYNIAGYRIARLLGLDNVPVSVERRLDGKVGSMTWWIDDVRMDERQRQKGSPPEWLPARTSGQLLLMRVFDALIANADRNMGNMVWSSNGKMWMIDHTRSFRLGAKLSAPATLVRCERGILQSMRTLTFEGIKAGVQSSLTDDEIKAMLKRRDEIVTLFDGKIAQRGEAAVLYTIDWKTE